MKTHTNMKLYAKIDDGYYWYPRYKEREGYIAPFQNVCQPIINLKVDKVLDLKLVLSSPVHYKGEDGWGKYYNFTGHEEPGHCFWCGKELRYGRYCKEHSFHYLGNYSWGAARHVCKVKHRISLGTYFCDDCGHEGRGDGFQVHHIQPMMGHNRVWHWLNHQDNLTHLCHDCHNRTHREMNGVLIRGKSKRKSKPQLDDSVQLRFL